MVITVIEYAKRFPYKGREISAKTIMRKCEDGLLPSNHHARQLPGGKGQWVIEIPDDLPESTTIKNPDEPDKRTLSRKFFNFK